MLYFALGWSATAHGGAVAGLVLTAVNAPRVLLLLVGGAVGDRAGARTVMIAGDAAMLAATCALAVLAACLGASTWLLVATGLVIGTVNAFYLPASGSMPRRLVAAPYLPRAMALRQAGAQAITMGGGPLGGVLVGFAGLAGAASVDAATFAVVLAVLVVIRPAFGAPAARTGQNLLRDAADGVRAALRDPVLRPSLALVGSAAAFLLPVLSLLIPLLARERHWGSGTAGLVLGAQGAGTVALTVVVVRRGAWRRPGLLSAAGLVVAGAGVLGVASAPGPVVAIAAALVAGLGNGLFSSHVAPLVLTAAPEDSLSRVQALLTLVQSLPLLLMNNLLGTLAGHAGASLAMTVCAVAAGGTGLLGLASRPLRRARMGPSAGDGDLGDERGPALRRAHDLQPAAERLDAVAEADEP